jgi:hypothetical protein
LQDFISVEGGFITGEYYRDKETAFAAAKLEVDESITEKVRGSRDIVHE